MELFLDVHDLDSSWLVSCSKDITVRSDTQCRHVLIKSVDLSQSLLLDSINYFQVSALAYQDDVFGIIIRGDAIDWVLLALIKDWVLILFPKSLFVGEFALGMRGLVLSEFLVGKGLHACWLIYKLSIFCLLYNCQLSHYQLNKLWLIYNLNKISPIFKTLFFS